MMLMYYWSQIVTSITILQYSNSFCSLPCLYWSGSCSISGQCVLEYHSNIFHSQCVTVWHSTDAWNIVHLLMSVPECFLRIPEMKQVSYLTNPKNLVFVMIRWCKYDPNIKQFMLTGYWMCLHSHILKLWKNCMYVLTTIKGAMFQIVTFFSINPWSFPSFAHEPLLTLKLTSSEPFFSQVPNVLNLEFVTFSWLKGGAGKSLVQPGRKQATATKLMIYSTYSPQSPIHFIAHCSNLCKPLKKIHKFVRPTTSLPQQWPPKNGDHSFDFSVQGTGGSPMGPDPENRMDDQDNGSPGMAISSRLPSELGHCHAKCPSLAPAEMSNTPCW